MPFSNMKIKEDVYTFHDDFLDNKDNVKKLKEKVVETAGFMPLAARMKQMEQAGLRAKFLDSEFTSKDFMDMYVNHPELDIHPDDDIEDVLEKERAREALYKEIQTRVRERTEEKIKASKIEDEKQRRSVAKEAAQESNEIEE